MQTISNSISRHGYRRHWLDSRRLGDRRRSTSVSPTLGSGTGTGPRHGLRPHGRAQRPEQRDQGLGSNNNDGFNSTDMLMFGMAMTCRAPSTRWRLPCSSVATAVASAASAASTAAAVAAAAATAAGSGICSAAMAIADRMLPLCDVLLGAAYADREVRDAERDEIRALLEDLAGELPTDIELHIAKFDPDTFDVATTAKAFASDSEDDCKKLLFLASAVIESDDEIDFAEDDYLRALAKALALPASALAGLTVEIETRGAQANLPAGPEGTAAAAEVICVGRRRDRLNAT